MISSEMPSILLKAGNGGGAPVSWAPPPDLCGGFAGGAALPEHTQGPLPQSGIW